MKKGCRKKQWQPKDFWVTFRMYQLSLDGQKDRVYKKYWDLYETNFIEKTLWIHLKGGRQFLW